MIYINVIVFVEKILRIQPDLKKLYLLLRASDPEAATQRMHDEVRVCVWIDDILIFVLQ